jgi:hypothetical protein
VRLEGITDRNGSLSLRFTGVRDEGTALRIGAVAVEQERGRVPRWRLGLYALLGPSWLIAGARARRASPRARAAALAGLLVALAAAIHFARLQTLAVLPRLLLALALTAAWAGGADALAVAARVPRSVARWVMAAAVVQLVLVANLRFGMIDAPWHTRNLWTFTAGGLTVSTAPGLEQVPYPPAFYALLSPLSSGAPWGDLFLVRFGMAVLQAASPLLVLALMRAGGASIRAASAGAIAAAVMPEALLVDAKGIACNIFGSFAGLLVIVAALRRVPLPLLAGLLAIAFLGHAGAGLSLAILLMSWWTDQWRRGELDARRWIGQVAAMAAAAAFAWLVYYREVAAVLAPMGGPTNPEVGVVRWFRVGKILQDLVLKFGVLPVLLAAAGWRAPLPPALRTLLRCWFLAGFALALVAVLTPFPLRFEFFLLPAIAAAAGGGAERLVMGRRLTPAAVNAAWLATFALQVLIGARLLQDRFEIIAVIMESPRWPFPFK